MSGDSGADPSPYRPQFSYQQMVSAVKACPGDSKKQQKFLKKFEKEINRFDLWCQNYYSETQTRLYVIIAKFGEKPANLAKIESDTEIVCAEILQFNALIGATFRSWVKIKYKFDKLCNLPNSAGSFADKLLAERAFCEIGFGDFVCMVSDIYYTVGEMKKARDKEAGQSDTWVPPSAFIRSTRKYWVRLEDLTKVKLEIAKNLPLLRFGKKQGVNFASGPANKYAGFAALNNSYDNNGEGDGAQTTSIYFDNDKLRLYHDKIVRKEGATLIRIRWYGNEGRTCFIERKTWHDSWVLNDSIKERFDLKYDQIPPFLKGTKTAREYVEDMQNLNKFSKKALCEILGLAQTIQDRILRLRLKPAVRTVYWRSAFQHTDNNRIRISIDTSLQLVKEPDNPGQGRWCRDMKKPVDPSESVMFPLAVLEIKLSGVDEVPTWIQNLVDSSYVISSYKFSKFMHGTGKLFGDKVNILPPWFCRTAVHVPGYKLKHWYRQSTEFVPNKLPFLQTHKWQLSQPPGLPPSKLSHTHLFDGLQSDYSSDEDFQQMEVEDGQENINLMKGYEFEGDIVNSTTPIWGNKPILPPPKTSGISQCYGLTKKPKKAGLVPLMQAVRSEPKTNFASERVLVKWLITSAALALAAILITDQNWGDVSRMVGASFLMFALIMCIYAGAVFQFRRQALFVRSVDGHYDDKVGPTIMMLVFAVYFIFALLFIAKPVPTNISPPFTRVYELSLSPSKVNNISSGGSSNSNTISDVPGTLQALRTSLVNQFPQYKFQGTLNNLLETRNVTYYDTAFCLLKKKQFVLREISALDSNGNPTTNMALAYQNGDILQMKSIDSTFNATFASATEHVRIGRQITYQRMKLIPITSLHIPRLIDTTHYFETLDLWDAVSPSDWNTPPVAINGITFKEEIYGGFSVSFGVPGRQGVIKVHAWSHSTIPVFLELTMAYAIPAGQTLTSDEIIKQMKFYDNLVDSIGTRTSVTSADVAYNVQPFCIS